MTTKEGANLNEANISVFGLGYVGIVSACCFASNGHNVIGVDLSKSKVDLINKGVAPIVETGLDKLLSTVIAKKSFKATSNAAQAIKDSDISLICVGTPSLSDGSIELSYLKDVCKEIGLLLAEKNSFHTVVLRSTIVPGTVKNFLLPILEKTSGKLCGSDFGFVFVPEFLREGSAIEDFYKPLKTVIGEYDSNSGSIVKKLFDGFGGIINCVSIETAEMTKYLDNSWHALKVTFANEIGAICKKVNVDSHELMQIFFQDTKLNISTHYLTPGFAFGGSCLPKDLRAICREAENYNLNLPVIKSIIQSNAAQIERLCDLIKSYKLLKIGIAGLTFKENTDDLRESPSIKLAANLIKAGYSIKIIDSNFDFEKVIGANRDYLLQYLPNIESCIIKSSKQFVDETELIVLTINDKSYNSIIKLATKQHVVVDLVRLVGTDTKEFVYEGIYW